MRHNLGLESLTYAASPAGRYLIAANEQALTGDGPTSTAAHGTVVRIVRHPLDGGADRAVAYLTDRVFVDGPDADNGVSELAALTPSHVLVLERAFVRGRGNAVRVYAVDLDAALDVTALADARAAAPAAKRLVVDLADLPRAGCATPRQPQRHPALANYEGLALGPTLPDGRRVLFLISDDNSRDDQEARVLVLAVPPAAL